MFTGCSSLTNLDLSSFKTPKLTNVGYFLYNCSKLSTLDISNFDTTNVTDIHRMFQNTALKKLDLRNFNITNATDLRFMFAEMKNLEEVLVDKNKWIINAGANAEYMFYASKISSVTYE